MPVNQTTLELKGDREIVITRAFNGPASIVFDTWTRPELVRRWWAPKRRKVEMAVCDADVRTGGFYRYVLRLQNGHEFAFSGRYTEVTPPSKLVYTQLYEPAAGTKAEEPGIIVTVTFDDRNGKTHVVSHTMCPTSDVRDAIIASGMEGGMRETMDQLDELVASLVENA